MPSDAQTLYDDAKKRLADTCSELAASADSEVDRVVIYAAIVSFSTDMINSGLSAMIKEFSSQNKPGETNEQN